MTKWGTMLGFVLTSLHSLRETFNVCCFCNKRAVVNKITWMNCGLFLSCCEFALMQRSWWCTESPWWWVSDGRNGGDEWVLVSIISLFSLSFLSLRQPALIGLSATEHVRFKFPCLQLAVVEWCQTGVGLVKWGGLCEATEWEIL